MVIDEGYHGGWGKERNTMGWVENNGVGKGEWVHEKKKSGDLNWQRIIPQLYWWEVGCKNGTENPRLQIFYSSSSHWIPSKMHKDNSPIRIYVG